MSNFRIFCLGGLVLFSIIAVVGKRIGDAAADGSAASMIWPITAMLLGGFFAVAMFGR